MTINQRAQFCTQAASRWLDLRLRMLGVAIVGAIAFIAVLQHHFQGVDPGQSSFLSSSYDEWSCFIFVNKLLIVFISNPS